MASELKDHGWDNIPLFELDGWVIATAKNAYPEYTPEHALIHFGCVKPHDFNNDKQEHRSYVLNYNGILRDHCGRCKLQAPKTMLTMVALLEG